MISQLSCMKKRPYLYYLIVAAFSAAGVTFALLMPKEYIYWNVIGVSFYTIGLFLSFFAIGFLTADSRSSDKKKILIVASVFGLTGGGLPYLFHLVFNQAFLIDLYAVMTFCSITQIMILTAADILILTGSAETFSLKKRLKEVLVIVLVCVMTGTMFLPFAKEFFGTYFRPYSFLSEPTVFVSSDDTYAVMFATSGPGTGVLTVENGDEIKEYPEIAAGMLSYNSQVHRIDVPKAVLESGTYSVSSKQTRDCTGTVYRMGKTIESKSYRVKPYQGNGDVSFMCISDNQGAAAPTQKAVKNAAKNYQYDFVMMLGDNSEAYNETEEDFISALLTVSGLASHGEIPTYYTLGNHEYRGMMSGDLFALMPTPSETGDFYYTFTMGDAYFTVLNFSNEDEDSHDRYGGLARYAQYKETEYEWLKAQYTTEEYKNYRYNVMISHIPVIDQFGEHDEYMFDKFTDLLQENDVQYVVSGHSHVKPQEFSSEGRPFKNLHVGSYYNSKAQFRNSIVRLQNGQYTYVVYDSAK